MSPGNAKTRTPENPSQDKPDQHEHVKRRRGRVRACVCERVRHTYQSQEGRRGSCRCCRPKHREENRDRSERKHDSVQQFTANRAGPDTQPCGIPRLKGLSVDGVEAHLVVEAVQQQIQTADRSLDLLIGLLFGQPAERSAAGAPGKVPTLRTDRKNQPRHKNIRECAAAGLTVWRMRM